jgi:membrane-bound serine protease (ClpP class)
MPAPYLRICRFAPGLAAMFMIAVTCASAQEGPPAPAPATPRDAEAPQPPPARSKESPTMAASRQGEFTGKVVVLPVGEEDLMNPARFEFMSRTMKRATEEGAQALVFDIDTPGGMAWNTTTVMMQDLERLGCRSISYVNPRAMSAGALIAIATDAIYMSPVSSIGAATPVNPAAVEMGEAERAKNNSGYMAMARSAAKPKRHNPAVVEAMIDKDVGLKIGDEEICPKGRLLTLDQEQATKMYDGKPLLAKGIAKNLSEVLKKEGLTQEMVTAEPKGFERIAIWITQYAAILLLVGLATGYMELQHPGFGVPGVISAVAFGLFFFGHFVAGSLVGYETVFIFLLGVVFIIIELFVFPGHLVPGLVGLLCIAGALIYTMAGWDINIPAGHTFPVRMTDYATALRNLGIAFVGAVAIILVFMRFFPSTGPFKFLVLRTQVAGEQAAIEGEGQRRASSISVGSAGVTRSAMRPYGHVDFDGTQLEAMIEGDYVSPGTQVRVRAMLGGKIIVERA